MYNYYKREYNKYLNIYIFQSGAEAMEQSGKIDILFLDIEMPEMDGIQCGRQIIIW